MHQINTKMKKIINLKFVVLTLVVLFSTSVSTFAYYKVSKDQKRSGYFKIIETHDNINHVHLLTCEGDGHSKSDWVINPTAGETPGNGILQYPDIELQVISRIDSGLVSGSFSYPGNQFVVYTSNLTGGFEITVYSTLEATKLGLIP